MHHLCALGSLSKFLSLSPIFCEALLSGVVTFVSFCKGKHSKWTCNFTDLHVKRDQSFWLQIHPRHLSHLRHSGDPLTPPGRSGGERSLLILTRQSTPLWAPCWLKDKSDRRHLRAIKAKMQNCYHCKQTWKYSNKHKPLDGNLPFPQKRNCSVPWWSEILVNCSSHLEY